MSSQFLPYSLSPHVKQWRSRPLQPLRRYKTRNLPQSSICTERLGLSISGFNLRQTGTLSQYQPSVLSKRLQDKFVPFRGVWPLRGTLDAGCVYVTSESARQGQAVRLDGGVMNKRILLSIFTVLATFISTRMHQDEHATTVSPVCAGGFF